MAGNSTDRFGGNALLVGGILWTLAVLLHPDVSTFEKASAAGGSVWAASHWAYLLGDLLLIGGLIALFRRLNAGANAGTATLAFTGGVIGFLFDVATTGGHMSSFPPVLGANAPNAQAMFDTITAVNNGLGGAGLTLGYIGIFLFGYVLWKEAWNASVAFAAMIVGAFLFVLPFVSGLTGQALFTTGAASYVVSVLLPLAYAYIGFEFRQRAGA